MDDTDFERSGSGTFPEHCSSEDYPLSKWLGIETEIIWGIEKFSSFWISITRWWMANEQDVLTVTFPPTTAESSLIGLQEAGGGKVEFPPRVPQAPCHTCGVRLGTHKSEPKHGAQTVGQDLGGRFHNTYYEIYLACLHSGPEEMSHLFSHFPISLEPHESEGWVREFCSYLHHTCQIRCRVLFTIYIFVSTSRCLLGTLMLWIRQHIWAQYPCSREGTECFWRCVPSLQHVRSAFTCGQS